MGTWAPARRLGLEPRAVRVWIAVNKPEKRNAREVGTATEHETGGRSHRHSQVSRVSLEIDGRERRRWAIAEIHTPAVRGNGVSSVTESARYSSGSRSRA